MVIKTRLYLVNHLKSITDKMNVSCIYSISREKRRETQNRPSRVAVRNILK